MNRDVAERIYQQRVLYYESELKPGGLFDLDDENWKQDFGTRAANSHPSLFAATSDRRDLEDFSGLDQERYATLLRGLRNDSRGFRHWHEIRIVRLVAADPLALIH